MAVLPASSGTAWAGTDPSCHCVSHLRTPGMHRGKGKRNVHFCKAFSLSAFAVSLVVCKTRNLDASVCFGAHAHLQGV